MNKCFLIFFLLTYPTHSHGMNFFEKASAWFSNKTNSQELWIKTIDKQVINCKLPTVQLSSLLTLAHELGLFTTEKKALPTNLTAKHIALFIAASNNQTNNFFESLTQEDLLILTNSAYALKSQKLYAQLIKIILPSDIDHQIATIISPMKKIKNLMIKNMQPKTTHLRGEIPLIENEKIKIQCTHDEQFSITTIHGTLFNDAPFNQCIIKDILTHRTIKTFDNYDVIQRHPTKNIIALGTTQKAGSIPTLILYDINTSSITELAKDKNIKFLIFSPNGNHLTATYNNENDTNISLWETSNTKKEIPLIGHTENIDALAFNPQSTYIISGSPEMKNCIILWDIKDIYLIKQATLQTNHHSHFKRFIFSKDGISVLAKTNKSQSFYFHCLNNKTYKYIPLKNPVYALFNAPTIPEKTFYKNEKQNIIESYNPYTLITKNGQPTDYSMIKVNQKETHGAAYKLNQSLNLHIISSKNKAVSKKELTGHTPPIHSLEFNDDDLLISACPFKTIIWNHKGTQLKTISPKCPTCHAYLSKNGQYLLTTALSKHGNYASACTEVTQFYTTPSAKAYNNINENLSTPQAILLNALYKQRKRNLEYTIKPNTLEILTINSFNNADEHKLINQILMITYSN